MKLFGVLATGVATVGLVVGMTATPAAPEEAPSFRQLLRSAPDSVAAGADDGARRLVFEESKAMEVTIDNAPADFSQGDEVVITSALTKAGKRVGRFDGHVAFTYVNLDAGIIRALLNGTASLREGEIEVQGVATFRVDTTADFSFAVVGGTRQYQGVDGGFHIVEDGDAVRYVFVLDTRE